MSQSPFAELEILHGLHNYSGNLVIKASISLMHACMRIIMIMKRQYNLCLSWSPVGCSSFNWL